jgi:hypothetical protein
MTDDVQSDIKSIVVERRDDGVKTTYATTPGLAPNVLVRALSPLRVIVTRTLRVYIQAILGIVTAGMTGADGGLLPEDFVALVLMAGRMSVAVGGFTALQNIAELLARMDQKYPEFRA